MEKDTIFHQKAELVQYDREKSEYITTWEEESVSSFEIRGISLKKKVDNISGFLLKTDIAI